MLDPRTTAARRGGTRRAGRAVNRARHKVYNKHLDAATVKSHARGRWTGILLARIAQGLFTKPVPLGPRSRAWPNSEVSAINAARIAGRTDAEIRALVGRLTAARTEGQEGGGLWTA